MSDPSPDARPPVAGIPVAGTPAPPAPASLPTPPKPLSERLFTITPVVLTVLSTLLAGLSNSEMTQAQYYRSLAAQNQSRAGDAWGFFQARRIRGTTLEVAVDLTPALSRSGKPTPELLIAEADRVLEAVRRGALAADRLATHAAAGGEQPAGEKKRPDAPRAGPLSSAVTRFRQTAAQAAGRLATAHARLTAELARPEVVAALAAVNDPRPADEHILGVEDPNIRQMMALVADHRPETELAPVLRQIRREEIREAIETAEAVGIAFETAATKAGSGLEEVGRLVEELLAAVRPVLTSALELETAESEADDGTTAGEVRRQVRGVHLAALSARSAAEALHAGTRAVQYQSTARRYRVGARYNQQTASLLEVAIRVDDLTSERHRFRSRRFFYGMLFAQAGVTIASLALATQRRSSLWAVAGLAGVTALVFSLYVYFYL